MGQAGIIGPENKLSWASRVRALFLKHEWLRGYTLLSPTLLVMVCALALPIFTLVVYSFWSQEYVTIDETFTLKNYEVFFDKWVYGKLLWRSILMSATVTLITVVLAFPVAYFVAFKVKNKMTWLILIILPGWTSFLLRVLAWKIMLGNNGVINSTLVDLGFIQGPLEFLLYSRFAVILTMVHAWATFAILPIYLSLSKIDRSLLEAAADLGESPIRTFLRVTLPLSMPGVIAAAVIQFIPTVGEYITPMMVGGPSGMMIGQLIAAQFGEANNFPLGAALTVIMMITITFIVLTFTWLSQRGTVKRREMETVVITPTESTAARGRLFGPLLVYVACYLMFLYIPSLMLPIFSFNDSIQMALPLSGFTFKWYLAIPEQPGLLTALGNSFKVAFPVAIVSTTLATIAARTLTRYRMPGQSAALGFILLPMVMPGIILAVGLLVVAIALGVPLSLWTIGIAHVVMTVPFSTLVVRSRLEGLSKNLEESALDLGENGWMTFWRVTFPLIFPGVAACLLMSFIASFDEFLFALFLGGDNVTLPVFMWTQVRFPQTLPTILAIGSLIFMTSVVLLGTAEWLRRMGRQRDEL